MNEGDAETELQPTQFGSHSDAQERIERGQWLVEQQYLRLRDQRARQRDALLLPARQLRGHPLRVRLHRDELEEFHRLLAPRRLVDATHLQGKRDIVEAGQVREQRVALEHHRSAALGGRQIGHVGRADEDVAFGCAFVPGDHPERRGLAASRRAQQATIAVGGDAEVDRVDGGGSAVPLGDLHEFETARFRHGLIYRPRNTPPTSKVRAMDDADRQGLNSRRFRPDFHRERPRSRLDRRKLRRQCRQFRRDCIQNGLALSTCAWDDRGLMRQMASPHRLRYATFAPCCPG